MRICKKTILFLMIVFCMLITISCNYMQNEMVKYYSNIENYVEATGIISYVNFDEENKTLYLGFEDLSEKFDDNCFKITGSNYFVVVEHRELFQVGKKTFFITAPKYYGNGYVMPIVSITIDDCCLLEYEIGFTNFIDWLKQ